MATVSGNGCESTNNLPTPPTLKLIAEGTGTCQQLPSANSASRMLTDYELSDDLKRVFIQQLEKKYGGGHQPHRSATLIQRAFRNYRLRQHYNRVTGNPRFTEPSALINNIKQVKIEMTSVNNGLERMPVRLPINSQPNLRYQPPTTTSLSSQLRAERQQQEQQNPMGKRHSHSSASAGAAPTDSGYPAQQRTFLELMSPRLAQRRPQQQQLITTTVFGVGKRGEVAHPSTHFHLELFNSNNTSESADQLSASNNSMNYVNTATSSAGGEICSGSVTAIVVGTNEEEEEELVDALGRRSSQRGAYHRSQSPAAHLASNLQVTELLASPTSGVRSPIRGKPPGTKVPLTSGNGRNKSPSASPIRHPQPPPIANKWATGNTANARSVWAVQRPVLGANSASPTFHQQVILQQQQQQLMRHQKTAKFNASSESQTPSPQQNYANVVVVTNDTAAASCVQRHNVYRRTAISRSNSNSGSMPYQTNSLPRLGSCRGEPYRLNGTSVTANNEQRTMLLQRHPPLSNGDLSSAGGSMQMRVEWTEQQRRRLYRIALNFFNKKPDRGVQLLIGWGFVEESPRALALLFKERRGLSKQMIGEFLGTLRSPFHAAVLDHMIEEIHMYNMEIDMALRQLLKHFRLPGEAQKIDHILQAFSRRYVACNPHKLPPDELSDTIYILAFAVIMLNTDLHTPSLKDSRRMKLEEFIKNLSHVEEARNLDKQMLTGIYERIKENEFQAGTDHVTQVMKVDQSIVSKEKPKLLEPHRRLICYCRLHQITDANKRQSSGAHQREIFLFNDLVLVCKLAGRKRLNSSATSSGAGQYQLRCWSALIGLHIEEFQNGLYPHGLVISCPDGQVLLFNAKNGDDRYRFVADVRESVAESTEMEQWRLNLELDKQSLAGIGARLADYNFHIASRHHHPPNDGSVIVHSRAGTSGLMNRQNTSIGSNSQSSSTGTAPSVGRTPTSVTLNNHSNSECVVQRDSGLPDMDHTSHSRSSHSSSPAEFT